ncbi:MULTISPECIES: glycosyltransferase family 2 protein [unclassified Sulfurospirillum]|uniref:glycosyltransferase family 2 protein n=1 Tax=unclassified Sulfurospirillum TaxID=2618290 RepID=UPI00050204E3|nr:MULTISPECIES: glycosyltransferase family 2 protein [unclassified Sulfurospirillum]KFL33536.1 hypothetical protein JU57_10135 [Sulfurospirillum sp. SCADC]
MSLNKEYKIIKSSGLFDAIYYLQEYADIRQADIDPLKHFCECGWKEGRNPSEKFDTDFYLETHLDVRNAGINPLVHFIKYGAKEGRKTHTKNSIVIEHKVSKIKKLVTILNHAKNNPHLVKKFLIEVRRKGLKEGLKKASQVTTKIDNEQKKMETLKTFDDLVKLFHNEPKIPSFVINKPIDIIIPVYNGFEYLEPLFSSIIKNTTLPYRLLIADDKSPDDRVLTYLKEFNINNSEIAIIIIENKENLGFLKTVNKLSKLTKNHFVLLNTDTEVPPHWLERLMYPIFEMKNIASTTPFTNAGTICSFPNYLEDNPIFEGLNVEKIDEHFQYVNFEKTYIEIPTGVGFCMGVNKNLVHKIGMFDEVYGKGYCEENDWCQRAIKEGYKNIHVTNLFIYHKHGGSFPSKEKQRLISQNLSVLNQKHSSYDEQVQRLVQKNELENLRLFLQIKIQNAKLNTTIIIDHALGGGANHYIDEGMSKRIEANKMTILIRYDFNLLKVFNITFIANQINYKFSASNLTEIFELLSDFKINEIFINSLVSYPDVHEAISEIIQLKEKTNSKVVLPIHDFFPVCPSYTLLNQEMKYCAVPNDKNICHNCLINNKNEFKIFEKETDIQSWRKSWEKNS